jgi:hypothetical protein
MNRDTQMLFASTPRTLLASLVMATAFALTGSGCALLEWPTKHVEPRQPPPPKPIPKQLAR